MESSIKKAGGIASALKSIVSIIVGLVLAVSSCSYAFSLVYENQRNIEAEKAARIHEFKLLEERNHKRYLRAMKQLDDLKKLRKEDEDRIIVLEKDNSELKGYIKGLKESKATTVNGGPIYEYKPLFIPNQWPDTLIIENRPVLCRK